MNRPGFIFGLTNEDNITPESIKSEPDWSLITRITGKLCPENVNLRSLTRMTETELANALKLTTAQSRKLAAALTLGERLSTEPPLKKDIISSAKDVYYAFEGRAREAKKESFYAVTMDLKSRLIDIHRISEGTLNITLVHPREAFIPVLRDSAASVIFVHNHPSGDPQPSKDDVDLTHRLVECGKILCVKVKDHVIVGRDCFVSLKDRGVIPFEGISLAAENSR